MLKDILLNEYKSVFKDIIKEYNNIIKNNSGYYNYLKIINHEIKEIISAFEILIKEKKNIFSSVFDDDFSSILHAIDKVLFKNKKKNYENVRLLLNTKYPITQLKI